MTRMSPCASPRSAGAPGAAAWFCDGGSNPRTTLRPSTVFEPFAFRPKQSHTEAVVAGKPGGNENRSLPVRAGAAQRRLRSSSPSPPLPQATSPSARVPPASGSTDVIRDSGAMRSRSSARGAGRDVVLLRHDLAPLLGVRPPATAQACRLQASGSTSQRNARPSSWTANRRLPSGVKRAVVYTSRGEPGSASGEPIGWRESTSQSTTARSACEVASVRPSGENGTARADAGTGEAKRLVETLLVERVGTRAARVGHRGRFARALPLRDCDHAGHHGSR